MQINIVKFLKESGVSEKFYPGKRLVHACKQLGEYKNHSVVFDWRNPDKIRLEVKAGLSGKDLDAQILQKYPVSLQSPTYVDVELVHDKKVGDKETEDDEDRAGAHSSGKSSGGGGKQPKKIVTKDMKRIAQAFGDMVESKIPEIGNITEMVVMGMQVAQEAYGAVMGVLAHQIQHAHIAATELLAQAGSLITKYGPPSFMEKKGDETAAYNYDRDKNADIGFKMTMS